MSVCFQLLKLRFRSIFLGGGGFVLHHIFFSHLQEILKQIKVKNLDTGEEMDLAQAEDRLPQSINPLSLHIMRLTSEYVR